MNLQEELNFLTEAKIENINFDTVRNKISICLKILDKDNIRSVRLVFDKVSSYYFIYGIGKNRFNMAIPEPDDYTELSLIGYHENGIGKINIESEKAWANVWYSSANFVLELWASNLFIEAESITIDDKIFKVGIPKKYNY